MIYTTLNKIKKYNPCKKRWIMLLHKLKKTKADDEPLAFITILDLMGLNDTLWALRSAPEYNKEWKLYAVWCAKQIQHLMTDPRSINMLDVAEKYANGKATLKELTVAKTVAETVAETVLQTVAACTVGAASKAVVQTVTWVVCAVEAAETAEAVPWTVGMTVEPVGAVSWAVIETAAWAVKAAETVSGETARAAQEVELRRVITIGGKNE